MNQILRAGVRPGMLLVNEPEQPGCGLRTQVQAGVPRSDPRELSSVET